MSNGFDVYDCAYSRFQGINPYPSIIINNQ